MVCFWMAERQKRQQKIGAADGGAANGSARGARSPGAAATAPPTYRSPGPAAPPRAPRTAPRSPRDRPRPRRGTAPPRENNPIIITTVTAIIPGSAGGARAGNGDTLPPPRVLEVCVRGAPLKVGGPATRESRNPVGRVGEPPPALRWREGGGGKRGGGGRCCEGKLWRGGST